MPACIPLRSCGKSTKPIRSPWPSYLLAVMADCQIDRPRRPRINPRVVKVKMSKFERKSIKHKSEKRNIEQELKIIWPSPDLTSSMELPQI
jgi:hypothetical protein